ATPLLNGRDLSGWKAEPASDWRLADGAVIYDGKAGASLTSERQFGDFEVKAEYQAAPGAHFSVLLRDAALFTFSGARSAEAWTPISFVLVGERVTMTSDGQVQ